MIQKILRLRESGHVRRCHCFPHHGHYDVAQHSFHMLLLLDALHPDPPKDLYRAIMLHDMSERWTGDSPAAAKRICPGLRRELNAAAQFVEEATGIRMPHIYAHELQWIKALDNLEFMMWCDDQMALGSEVAAVKRQEVVDWFHENEARLPDEIKAFLEEYTWERTSDDLD